MNTYKVHKVYILAFGLGLLILADTTIREFLDPTYHVISTRYLPRALFWYIVIYCWYKFLTTAYKIEIMENDSIRTTSIVKKTNFKAEEIKAIKERTLFVDIISEQGTVSVSTLIDGVSNVKHILQAIIPKAATDNLALLITRTKTVKQRIINTIITILLIAYAVYIELQQIELHLK